MNSQLTVTSNEIIEKLEIKIPLSSILRRIEKIIKGANEINMIKIDFLPEQMYFGAWVAFQENNGDGFNKHLKINISQIFNDAEIKEINTFISSLLA